jgi:Zn-dependent protease
MDLNQILLKIAVMGLPILTAITLHEVAHGWAARSCGDRTAEAQGRLSLNPINHVDPMGTVIVPGLLLLLGAPFLFGWAKPVPVNPNRFKHYRADWVKVAAAGPLANFAMALAWGAVGVVTLHVATGDAGNIYADWLLQMSDFGVVFNIVIAVFNLIPIPPLDGGRVLTNLLPARNALAQALDKVEPFGLYIVLALAVTGLLGAVIGTPVALISGLYQALFSLFT